MRDSFHFVTKIKTGATPLDPPVLSVALHERVRGPRPKVHPPSTWGLHGGKLREAAHWLTTNVIPQTVATWNHEEVLIPCAGLGAVPREVAVAWRLPTLLPRLRLRAQGRLSSPDLVIGVEFQHPERPGYVDAALQAVLVDFGPGQIRWVLPRVAAFIDAMREAARLAPSEERRDLVLSHLRALVSAEGVELLRERSPLDVVQAGALHFRPVMAADGLTFEPSLHGQGAEPEMLLKPSEHAAFLAHLDDPGFLGVDPCLAVEGTVVLLDDLVRDRLVEMKRFRRAPAEERDHVVATFRSSSWYKAGGIGEWHTFADHVEGYAEMEEVELDFLSRPPRAAPPDAFSAFLGRRTVQVRLGEALVLSRRMEEARAEGRAEVLIDGTPRPLAEAEAVERQIAPLVERWRDEAQGVLFEDQPDTAATEDLDEQIAPSLDDLVATAETAPDPEERNRRKGFLAKTNFLELHRKAEARPRAVLRGREAIAPSLHTPMAAHQRETLARIQDAWEAGLPGMVLADEPGLGKTYSVLAALLWMSMQASLPILVVVPNNLVDNWLDEAAAHFAGNALGTPFLATGEAFGRYGTGGHMLALQDMRKRRWVVTTYETLRRHQVTFASQDFAAVVYDEAQVLKSPLSYVRQAAWLLKAEFSLAVTGTPVENQMEDLWSIVDLVHPGFLGPLRAFSGRLGDFMPFVRQVSAKLMRPAAGPAVLVRHEKEDVLKDLPPKTVEKDVRIMPPRQREAYDQVVWDYTRGPLRRGQGAGFRLMQHLGHVSLHPAGLGTLPERPTDAQVEDYLRASARTAAALDRLLLVQEAGEKALVFANDIHMIEELARAYARRLGLDGPLPFVSSRVKARERREVIAGFRRREGFGALFLTPKIGGVGLTITEATHVIHLTRWWNPATERQCEDRAHRMGQIRPVSVLIPQALHPDPMVPSYDQRVDAILANKRALSRGVLMPQVTGMELSQFLMDFDLAA